MRKEKKGLLMDLLLHVLGLKLDTRFPEQMELDFHEIENDPVVRLNARLREKSVQERTLQQNRPRNWPPWVPVWELPLDPPSGDTGVGLRQLIRQRRTVREFPSGTPITPWQLSYLLEAYRVQRERDGVALRGVPSAGALYPVHVYVVLLRAMPGGAPEGVFYYDPHRHQLVLLRTVVRNTLLRRLRGWLTLPEILDMEGAGVAFLLVMDVNRFSWKYQERGIVYGLLEVGHLAQNILLLGEAVGVAFTPIGGLYGEKIRKDLGLPLNEVPVYMLLGGRKEV